jgi:hypothetical protein
MHGIILSCHRNTKSYIKLRLKEVGQESMIFSDDCGFSETDKHACEIFGIKWEENNNRYWITKATIINHSHTQQKIDWLDEYPMGLPLTTISHYFDENVDQRVITFPGSLPANFVAKLEKENITLKNCLFLEPIEITLKLGYIKKKKPQPTFLYKIMTFTGFAAMGIIAWLIYLSKNS